MNNDNHLHYILPSHRFEHYFGGVDASLLCARLSLNCNKYNKPYGLIEGIGNMGHPNVTGDLLFPCPISNLIPSLPTHYTDPVFLNYYNENGELVYSSGRKASVESIGVDNDATEVTRYDIYGRLLTNPTKGINIIKMSDGSTRKVFVK